MDRADHIVITPAHDEREYLPSLIRSMRAQGDRPGRWVLVNDGSTDATTELIEEAAAEHPWITALSYPKPGERARGSRVAQVVLWALKQTPGPWRFISKIDADLELPQDYFARVLEAFTADPSLGICGGSCVVRNGVTLERERVAADHTRGALKTYRRSCWDAIGGIRPVHGWDGLDTVYAQMHGFATRHLPDLEVVHRRSTGGAEGALAGRFTAGRFAHFLGYHPAFMFARSVRRMADRPYVAGGMAMLAGYLYNWGRREPIYDDPEAVRFLRRKQLGQLSPAGLLRRLRRHL